MPAISEPIKMPIFAGSSNNGPLNARFDINNDIVKPIPPRKPKAPTWCLRRLPDPE